MGRRHGKVIDLLSQRHRAVVEFRLPLQSAGANERRIGAALLTPGLELKQILQDLLTHELIEQTTIGVRVRDR